MPRSTRQSWVRAAVLVGAVYFLIGRAPLPAEHLQLWRLASWLVSGIAYAAHIAYEEFRLRNAPRSAALHVAVAVALGAFALAAVGMTRSLSTGAALRPTWLLALVLWPAFTAIPAYLGALMATAALRRFPRSAS